jgi:hypothetical protein
MGPELALVNHLNARNSRNERPYIVIGASLSGIDALSELVGQLPADYPDRRVLRYRCRSGHAFSAENLLSGQADGREPHFSLIFGALIEEASLAKRILREPRFGADPEAADGLSTRIEILEKRRHRSANGCTPWPDLSSRNRCATACRNPSRAAQLGSRR